MDPRIEDNRRRWDELVPLHAKSEFYDVAGFRSGATTLKPPELAALGDVRGQRILHLQCHFGLDSLSLVRAGAEVTGVDFSSAAIEQAKALSNELGLPAKFVCSDVLWLDTVLNERFDVVFTSWGVLGWLPDLTRWARVVARFLRPGGRLVLVEMHPVASALAAGSVEGEPLLRPAYRYFASSSADLEEENGSYACPEAHVENQRHHWWNYGIADVLAAVRGAGLEVQSFEELPRVPYPVFDFCEPDGDGAWRLKGGIDSIPLSYVLTAARPI